MKKSTKFLLIGGMSLFALGCILLLIGILTGGMKQWNEHTHQNGIVFQKYFCLKKKLMAMESSISISLVFSLFYLFQKSIESIDSPCIGELFTLVFNGYD